MLFRLRCIFLCVESDACDRLYFLNDEWTVLVHYYVYTITKSRRSSNIIHNEY